MKTLLVFTSSLIFFASPVIAQEINEDTSGLTCQEVLRMNKDSWTQYYFNKTGNSSLAATDRAYLTYAECHKERNNEVLATLPANVKHNISKYRQLYHQYRVSSINLQRAYAGGGTAYGHAIAQSTTLDEEMVEALIRLQRQSKPSNNVIKNDVKRRIEQLRSQVRQSNPKNQKVIDSSSYRELAISSYAEIKQSSDLIISRLLKENGNTSLLILKFMEKARNSV